MLKSIVAGLFIATLTAFTACDGGGAEPTDGGSASDDAGTSGDGDGDGDGNDAATEEPTDGGSSVSDRDSGSGGDGDGDGDVTPAPGETHAAYCTHLVEDCGETYYDTPQDCVDDAVGYWGDCESRLTALDGFGACAMTLDCDVVVGGFIPGQTDCADAYGELQDSAPCE